MSWNNRLHFIATLSPASGMEFDTQFDIRYTHTILDDCVTAIKSFSTVFRETRLSIAQSRGGTVHWHSLDFKDLCFVHTQGWECLSVFVPTCWSEWATKLYVGEHNEGVRAGLISAVCPGECIIYAMSAWGVYLCERRLCIWGACMWFQRELWRWQWWD